LQNEVALDCIAIEKQLDCPDFLCDFSFGSDVCSIKCELEVYLLCLWRILSYHPGDEIQQRQLTSITTCGGFGWHELIDLSSVLSDFGSIVFEMKKRQSLPTLNLEYQWYLSMLAMHQALVDETVLN